MKQQDYQTTKDQTYNKYKTIRQVYCPYLKENIIFNSNGFRHLIYKNKHIKRDETTQLFRFRLLPKAVKLLTITTTLQEEEKYKSDFLIKQHNLRIEKKKDVVYLGFIAIIDRWKIKVIVKKIGNGNYFFWSVIPNWITNRKRDTNKKYINFSGDLEEN